MVFAGKALFLNNNMKIWAKFNFFCLREWEIFGCIAHLIKGAIFYIYGLITFARYLGSFADKGWAWNYIPNASKFSFEMIECSLIFFYGITNTWMEHFGNDSAWTHKDLEHASIAFM